MSQQLALLNLSHIDEGVWIADRCLLLHIPVTISSISYWSPNLVNPMHISLHSLASVITWWKMISCLSVTASLAGASVIVLLCIYSQQIQTGVAEEKTERESEKEWLVNKKKRRWKTDILVNSYQLMEQHKTIMFETMKRKIKKGTTTGKHI